MLGNQQDRSFKPMPLTPDSKSYLTISKRLNAILKIRIAHILIDSSGPNYNCGRKYLHCCIGCFKLCRNNRPYREWASGAGKFKLARCCCDVADHSRSRVDTRSSRGGIHRRQLLVGILFNPLPWVPPDEKAPFTAKLPTCLPCRIRTAFAPS